MSDEKLTPGQENPVEVETQRRNRLSRLYAHRLDTYKKFTQEEQEIIRKYEEEVSNLLSRLKESEQTYPTFDEVERRYFTRLMEVANYNMSKAVEISKMSRSNLYRRISIYGIPRHGHFQPPPLDGVGPNIKCKEFIDETVQTEMET